MIKQMKLQNKFFNHVKYQIRLKTSMKGSDVVFDCVHLLHLKCHKINFKCGRFFVFFPIG